MAPRSPLARLADRHAAPDRPPPGRVRRGWRLSAFVKTLTIIAAAIALALLFAQDQETLRVESPLAADDPAFPDYVAALTGSGITRGDQYQILANGIQFFPAMLDAIRSAKRRISFESYIYDAGAVAADFTTALAGAASRGVEVRVLVDAVGGSTMERSHVERLQAAGVRIGTFNPLRWYRSKRSTTGRTGRSWWWTAKWASPAAPAWPITGSATPTARRTGAIRTSA